jgi:hypothetical protein
MPSLRRDRFTWVNQNYIRDETLLAANARLVAVQNQISVMSEQLIVLPELARLPTYDGT